MSKPRPAAPKLEARLDRITDDELIDFATTASDRGIRLVAEMTLRKRYPSRIVVRKLIHARGGSQ